jgi:hypothetical protein
MKFNVKSSLFNDSQPDDFYFDLNLNRNFDLPERFSIYSILFRAKLRYSNFFNRPIFSGKEIHINRNDKNEFTDF